MSSQELESCLENVQESLKGFTDEGEICTCTDMQNILEKFLYISKKHVDEENIPLLVACCLKYVDFLLQSPELSNTTHSQHKRNIHNYFSVLSDIGRKVELRNKFLREMAVPILERIVDPSVSSLYGRELASYLNRIAEKSNRALRNEIVNFTATIYIYKVTDLIETCGDYEYQTCLVEILFRMCSSDFILKKIKEFFPGAEYLQRCLLDIKAENFDRNLRIFLNAVNHLHKRVFSIAACAAYLDEYSIEPPVADNSYDMELWVDFNVLSGTIGIYCSRNSFVTKSLSEEDEWELLTFFKADISVVELKWEKIKSKESFQLSVLFHKSTPCHYIFYTTAEAASANVLKLIIQDDVVDELLEVLLQMFGEKFEGFKETSQNSEISAYYTPELELSESVIATSTCTNKRRISSDGHSERSYANVLLCRNVEDKNDNLMSHAQNIKINSKACKKYFIFSNEMVNHTEENKENVANYSLLDQEGDSMEYFSCKENVKPENDWYYFSLPPSSERTDLHNAFESIIAHNEHPIEKLVGTNLIVEQSQSEKLDPSTECDHSASVKVSKPTKKPRQKRLTKKAKVLTKLSTKISNVELPSIEEMPLDLPLVVSSSQITMNEQEVTSGLSKNFNPESEELIHESEVLTYESKLEHPKKPRPKPKKKKNADTLSTIQKQTEACNNKQKEKMKTSREEDSKENLLENSNKEELSEEPSQPDLRKDKPNSCENVKISMPFIIVKRTNFEEYFNKDTPQYLNDEKQTSINAEEIDDLSISSSIFNVTTQNFENDDLNETPVDLGVENNELRQKESTPSPIKEQREEYFEPSSLLNATENEPELNETVLNHPDTRITRLKKRKLFADDPNKTSVDLAMQNNELRQKESTPSAFEDNATKKRSKSSVKEQLEEFFEPPSLLNATENEPELNETILNHPDTRTTRLKKRKLFTYDSNKTLVDLALENNELGQKESSPSVFQKRNESPVEKHREEIFESSSLLNATENEPESNEKTVFNRPYTIITKPKKRKLFTFGDLSYLETVREASSPNSEIAVAETIVTEALVHEPVHYSLHNKQKQIIAKKIKNIVNHKDLDSINVIEEDTKCDRKQANLNNKVDKTKLNNKIEKSNLNNKIDKSNLNNKIDKKKVNDVKAPRRREKSMRDAEKSLMASTPNNEHNKQCFLPSQETNLSHVSLTQAEFFTKHLSSIANDSKPKKGKKPGNQKPKCKDMSSKMKLQNMDIDSFNETKNEKYVEMYVAHTSCFDKPSTRKEKSTKQKSKYDKSFSKVERPKLNTVKKRKSLDYSDATVAKRKRVLNEPSAIKASEVSAILKQKIIKSAMINPEVKNAKTRVRILQNIVLQPATNSIDMNSLDVNHVEGDENVQNNNFDFWLQKGET